MVGQTSAHLGHKKERNMEEKQGEENGKEKIRLHSPPLPPLGRV
jgi:hypothetical protein